MVRKSVIVVAAAMFLFTTACAGDGPPNSGSDNAGTGDYAFGSQRSAITTAIETTYSSENAKGRWDGDTFTLSMNGDATATNAGFTDCLVITMLLNEGDLVRIEFPNGTVKCEDMPG